MISLLRRKRSATIGLDLGSGFVKGVEIDHSGAEPELVRVVQMPLSADAIVEGEILDPPLVADTVRQVLQELEPSGKSVVTAVGGRDVIVKKIQMDRIPEEDAREVIRWEAEQYVPFDMESVRLDFHILDPEGEGLQMDVLLVAAKRELIEQKMLLLGDAGVTPEIIDVDAFALHNAFEFNYPGSAKGVHALVNVGNELTTVNVLQNGVPVVTRDIPLGSRHLREDLQRRHGLSAADADAVIQGGGERQSEYEAVFKERNEELAMQVERAVAFLAMDLAATERLAGVYLSGGGAGRPQLSEAIAGRLSARVEIANPLQRLRVRPNALGAFPIESLAPMLMLPIGLGLRPAA